jgi:hypothetical protein
MNKPKIRSIWFASLMAALIGALALIWLSIREPTYQGRGLSEWLVGLENPATATNLVQTSQALREMGDKAAIKLVPILEASDSPLKLILMDLTKKQPFPFAVLQFTPASVKNARAAAAFEIMTNQASAAIPALVSLLLKSGHDPRDSLDDPLNRAENALRCIGSRVVPHLRIALVASVPGSGNLPSVFS